MIVSIMGLGLIGGSLAKDLRARNLATRLVGYDQDPSHQKQALSLGLVDDLCVDTEKMIQESDVLVVALPVAAVCESLPKLMSKPPAKLTLFEVGSTKKMIADSVAALPHRSQLVLTHPMAGTEFSGPTAAKLGLFENRTVVFCDAEKSEATHLDRVSHIYKTLGAKITYMNSAEQDMHTAYVSHLSHISSFMLACTVLDIEKNVKTIFDLASGGFESTVRLAKSSPSTWNPIFEQNKDFVLKALGAYIEHLTEFRSAMEQSNWTRTRELLEKANEIRRVLEPK